MKKPKIPVPPNDKQMILTPDNWPRWPLLPLIKRGPDYKSGVILGDPIGNKVRFLENAYVFRMTDEDLSKAVLRDIDELIAEGWEVD